MGLGTVKPLSDAPAAGLIAGRTIKRRFTNIWKNEGDLAAVCAARERDPESMRPGLGSRAWIR
jgi:hypothetical protein